MEELLQEVVALSQTVRELQGLPISRIHYLARVVHIVSAVREIVVPFIVTVDMERSNPGMAPMLERKDLIVMYHFSRTVP